MAEIVHGFSFMSIDGDVQTDQCVCGAKFSQCIFDESDGLNDHLRQAWKEQQPVCEWEDLKHLQGRDLRDRLKSRAQVWKTAESWLRSIVTDPFSDDGQDFQVWIGRIYDAELAVTQEAERQWDAYLDSFEPLLETDEGCDEIVRKLGAVYLRVISDRAAQKRMRASAEAPK